MGEWLDRPSKAVKELLTRGGNYCEVRCLVGMLIGMLIGSKVGIDLM